MSYPPAGYEQTAGGGLRPVDNAPGAVDGDGFNLVPTDWEALVQDGVPEIEYLFEPYLPRGARVWLWGATGTAKSIWALWAAASLSRQGIPVAYFSEENRTREDLRRLALIRPKPKCFRWFHRSGMDLTDPRWVNAMLDATEGCELVVFDTWTDLWHGDENSNPDIRDFDADVLKPLQAQGATPITIHHTGHPVMFSNRKGATAGRGASALGQKADVTLEFKAEDNGAFTIVYGKARIGGERQPDRTFKVVDLEDGLDIIEVAGAHGRAVDALTEKMAQAVLTAPRGYLTSTELRTAAGGGRDAQGEALTRLEADSRVVLRVEKVQTIDGKWRTSKVWRPYSDNTLLGGEAS